MDRAEKNQRSDRGVLVFPLFCWTVFVDSDAVFGSLQNCWLCPHEQHLSFVPPRGTILGLDACSRLCLCGISPNIKMLDKVFAQFRKLISAVLLHPGVPAPSVLFLCWNTISSHLVKVNLIIIYISHWHQIIIYPTWLIWTHADLYTSL